MWHSGFSVEKTVPQVFPTTAPGSFTELPEGSVVMTNFYPYQWDLNYANPAVFRDMTENLLYLANRGIDVIRAGVVHHKVQAPAHSPAAAGVRQGLQILHGPKRRLDLPKIADGVAPVAAALGAFQQGQRLLGHPPGV